MVSSQSLQFEKMVMDGHPFDAAAAGYDSTFTETRLGRFYRGMVRQRLSGYVRPGGRALELGCGTGADASWLARHGMTVIATDASPAMLAVAGRTAERNGVTGSIEFRPLDLNDPASFAVSLSDQAPDFQLVLANFGPLNCVEDRRGLSRRLAGVVAPGGYLAMTVMGPLCPWEIIWHGARLEFRVALRRLRSGAPADAGGPDSFPVWYPSMRRLEVEFGSHFKTVERAGLGLLLPPSGMNRLVDRAPRLFRPLGVIDRRLAGTRVWHWLNDHYLLVMERTAR